MSGWSAARLRPAQHAREGVAVELAEPDVEPDAVRVAVERLGERVVVGESGLERVLDLGGRADPLGVLAERGRRLDDRVAPLGQVALHAVVDLGLGEPVEHADDVGPVLAGHVVADRAVHVLPVARARRRDVVGRALDPGRRRHAGVDRLAREHARDGGVAVTALEREDLRGGGRRRTDRRRGPGLDLVRLRLALPLRHDEILPARPGGRYCTSRSRRCSSRLLTTAGRPGRRLASMVHATPSGGSR